MKRKETASQHQNLSGGMAQVLNENIDILVGVLGNRISHPNVTSAIVALQTIASILEKGGLR